MNAVLYVDDEPDLLDIGKMYLEQFGDFSVSTADSAPAAMSLLEKEHFDAIISDYQMPGMDGLEFLKQVRLLHGQIPFIFFTGRGGEEVAILALNNGADFYLRKGGDPHLQFAELAHKVRQAVQLRQAEISLQESERRYRESEEKYRLIADNATDIIWILDIATRKFTYFSPSVEKIRGFTPEEALEIPLEKTFTPESYARAMTELKKSLELDKEHKVEHGRVRVFEFQDLCKDGSYISTETRLKFLRNAEGVPISLQGITRDITERKRAEKALKESEDFNRGLVENMPDMVIVYGHDRKIRYANPAVTRMLGYSMEESAGTDIMDYVVPEQRSDIAGVISERLTTGNTEPVEVGILGKEGQRLTVITKGTTVHYHTEPAVLLVLTDISDRKKAEEQLKRFSEDLEQKVAERTKRLSESLAERELLLREIHHRVKNNLQIIISLLSLQSRTLHDPDVIAALKDSTMRVRAMSMVHEKLYTGKDLSHIELRNYVTSLANSQVAFYQISPGKIKLEITGEEIMLDINTAIPLGLVVNELVSNALKHAFPGERRGTIRIDVRKEGDRLEVSVADDGVGAPESLDWQSTSSLGLRLVKTLVEQLDGTIEREPAVTGTVFRIVARLRQTEKQDRPESKGR